MHKERVNDESGGSVKVKKGSSKNLLVSGGKERVS